MIEIVVKDYLESKTSVPIYVEEEPVSAPTEFILIKNTSESESEHVKSATIAIESYGGSTYDAAVLNETIKDLMGSLTECKEVSGITLNTSYKDNDTTKKRYRYRAAFQVVSF